MTQDEIIEMWDEVVKYAPSEVRITEFAKLVAAKEQKKWEDQTVVEIHEAVLEEREACAVACEKELEYWGWDKVFDAAKLIRARGKS